MPEEPTLQKVYKAGSEIYDLGDYDTFTKKMQDAATRQKVYNALSEHYDLGDFATFEGKVQLQPTPKVKEEIGLGGALKERFKPTVYGRGAGGEAIIKALTLPATAIAAALPTKRRKGGRRNFYCRIARGNFSEVKSEELETVGSVIGVTSAFLHRK
jgi:hypothetical protein